MLAILLALALVSPVAAASKRECLSVCADRIAACASSCGDFGVAEKACRAAVLKTCRREGVETCAGAPEPERSLAVNGWFRAGFIFYLEVTLCTSVDLGQFDLGGFTLLQGGFGEVAERSRCERGAVLAGQCWTCELRIPSYVTATPATLVWRYGRKTEPVEVEELRVEFTPTIEP